MSLQLIKEKLEQYTDKQKAETQRLFFKHSRDSEFLGIPAKEMRAIAKTFWQLSLDDTERLISSNVHDERNVGYAILRRKYEKGNEQESTEIFNFYLEKRHYIRDWANVDDSAPYIVGHYLLNRNKAILYELSASSHLWDKRIAIVSTWWFIRQNKVDDTIKISKILLHDKNDLIQKAVGWMLREVGKKQISVLESFLQEHHLFMPRTMLRYAIEKFSPEERSKYLRKK